MTGRLALLVFLWVSPALATDYYVDATAGSDAAAGTSVGTAWKTLSKVNGTALVAGDTVHLKRGETWREQLRITWSGSAGSRITFTDYGSGALPIINGGTTVTGWTGPTAGIYTKALAATAIYIMTEDLIPIIKATSAALADGNWYYDNVTIYYKPTSGVATDHVVDRASRAGCITWDTANSYITIQNIQTMIGYGVGIRSTTADMTDITIQGMTVIYAPTGISAATSNDHTLNNISFIGNTISYSGESMFVGEESGNTVSTNLLISGNSIDHTGYYVGTQSWDNLVNTDQEAIGLQNISTGSIIQGNVLTGGIFSGISVWDNNTSSLTGSIYQRNSISGFLGPGFIMGGTGVDKSNATIAYNLIFNNGSGASGPHGGLRLNRNQLTGSGVYNNTLYGNDVNIYLFSLPADYTLKNNLSLSPTNQHVLVASTIGTNVLNNNLYYPDGAAKFSLNSVTYDFAGWKVASSQDAAAVSGDPLLVDAVSANFMIASGASPAINAGVALGFTNDFIGYPIVGLPDIGAYEYEATPGRVIFFGGS